MKKKIILVLVAVAALIFILAGCGDKGYAVSKKTYDNVISVNGDNQFIASEDGKLYLFKQNGKKVFKQGYDELAMFGDGLLVARNSGDYGYALLDRQGNLLIGSTADARITDAELIFNETNEEKVDAIGAVNSKREVKAVKITAVNADLELMTAFYALNNKSLMLDFVKNSDIIDYEINTVTKTATNENNIQYSSTYDGMFISIKEGESVNIKIFGGENNLLFGGTYQSAEAGIEHNRFFVADYDNEKVYLVKRDGTLLDAGNFSTVFSGERNGYIIDIRESVTTLINIDNDDEKVIGGISPSIKGRYLCVENEGNFLFYDEDLNLKLTSDVSLSYYNYAYYNSAEGVVYDADLKFLTNDSGSVTISYGAIVDGEYCLIVKTAQNYDLYKNGTLLKQYPASYALNTSTQIYFTDSLGNNIFYSFKMEQEIVKDTRTNPIGISGVSYTLNDGVYKIFNADNVCEVNFGGNSVTVTHSIQNSTKVIAKAPLDIITVTANVITYLDTYVEGEAYTGRTKTETKYAYFIYSSATGLVHMYDGYNRVNITGDNEYLAVSTIGASKTSYNNESLLTNSTAVYKINYAYVNKALAVTFDSPVYLSMSNVEVMNGYLLAENNYSDKKAIYTIDGSQILVDAKFIVRSIAGNKAIVQFSDNDLYGVIELKKKGYKIVEDINKQHIYFLGEEYYMYSEIKDGIEKVTLKTIDGKKVLNNILYIKTINLYSSDLIVDGMQRMAFIADTGKNGYKVITLNYKVL